MNPTTFDIAVAAEVENAVLEVYNCKRHDIHQFKDSEVKKVVVFLLYHHFKFDWHMIGRNYQMTYLYVPTVAAELAYWYGSDLFFKEKIDLVLSKVSIYDKKKVMAA
jgi:hypothetical protein